MKEKWLHEAAKLLFLQRLTHILHCLLLPLPSSSFSLTLLLLLVISHGFTSLCIQNSSAYPLTSKNPTPFLLSVSSSNNLVCRADEYKIPDPIPEFTDSETDKFRNHLLKKLSKKDIYGDSLEEVVGICTECTSERKSIEAVVVRCSFQLRPPTLSYVGDDEEEAVEDEVGLLRSDFLRKKKTVHEQREICRSERRK